MRFNKAYRQYPKGYILKDGEVSKAQLALFIKRGVIGQDTQKIDIQKPKHVGAGYYELSNGERVRGKEEAIAKQNELV